MNQGRWGGQADPINLLERALADLPAGRCCLLADREFIGGAWLRHLQKQPVDFVRRVSTHYTMERADGRIRSLEHTTRNQPRNTTRVYEKVHLYEGPNTVPVHIICHRPRKGVRLFLATNRTDFNHVVSLYKQRWTAETALGFLKSKGFDLETTHLRDSERIRRLLSVCPSPRYGGYSSESSYTNKSRRPAKNMDTLRKAASKEDSIIYNTSSPHRQSKTNRTYA